MMRLGPATGAASPVAAHPAEVLPALAGHEHATAVLEDGYAAHRVWAILHASPPLRAFDVAGLDLLDQPGPRGGLETRRRLMSILTTREAEVMAASAQDGRPPPRARHEKLAADGRASRDDRAVLDERNRQKPLVTLEVGRFEEFLEDRRRHVQRAQLSWAPQAQAVLPAAGTRLQVALEEPWPAIGTKPMSASKRWSWRIAEANAAQLWVAARASGAPFGDGAGST
mmetsp:Transcript_95457/g.269915  ORF Transcript_95457/g.269915 Transcript_95457/m.269915 type:complete len:227 (-) Transcript_95457:890-1570(-)